MGAKRFRIAFSFAGEKRAFVEKVADLLAQSFREEEEAILYDKFHEAEFSRARLGRYLLKLYNEQSDLVVVVICRDYVGKEWCGLEWDAIFDLLKQRRESEVMLSRFDYAIVDGLFSDAGFSELDHKTPEQFAALILERLARNEGKPKDSYTKPERPSTPEPPAIPVDISQIGQYAPVNLIGRESETQTLSRSWNLAVRGDADRPFVLTITGMGGAGKSSLVAKIRATLAQIGITDATFFPSWITSHVICFNVGRLPGK